MASFWLINFALIYLYTPKAIKYIISEPTTREISRVHPSIVSKELNFSIVFTETTEKVIFFCSKSMLVKYDLSNGSPKIHFSLILIERKQIFPI